MGNNRSLVVPDAQLVLGTHTSNGRWPLAAVPRAPFEVCRCLQPLFVVLGTEAHTHATPCTSRRLTGVHCSQVRVQPLVGDLQCSSSVIPLTVVMTKADTSCPCRPFATRRSAACKTRSLAQPILVMDTAETHVGRIDRAGGLLARATEEPMVIGRGCGAGVSHRLPAPVVHWAESPALGGMVATSHTAARLRWRLHASWTRKGAIPTPADG